MSKKAIRLSSVEWIDPALIRFKISPHDDLIGRKGGDWDLERRFPLAEAVKYRSIVERYAQGRKWEETALFADLYRRRLESGDSVRGAATMGELVEQYYTRVDGMFADLKHRGFVANGPLPKLLIGRGGEVFIGNQGNHRLAMAHVLGLDRFAGEVICRHSQSSKGM